MPGLTDDVSQPSVLAVVLGRYHQLHLGGLGPSTLHLTGCPGYTLDSSEAVHRELFSSSHRQGNGPREVVCRSHRSTASLGVFSSLHLLVFYLSAPVVDRCLKMMTFIVSASHPQFLLRASISTRIMGTQSLSV